MSIKEHTKILYHFICEVEEHPREYPSDIFYNKCYISEDFDSKLEGFSSGWTLLTNGMIYCPGCSKAKAWDLHKGE